MTRMGTVAWMIAGTLGMSPVWAETNPPAGTASEPAGAATGQTQGLNFGNMTSETLVSKGWGALNQGDGAAAEAYTKKCIDLYEGKAVQQAATLTDFAPKDKAFSYWALNDVATSYLILGQAMLAQGKIKEAQEAFNTVIERFPYAQAWDPQGWFWKVADAARDKLVTMGTAYDFGDYKSSTLTVKAWEALGRNDHTGVALYTGKCIELYEPEAKKQQASLTDFAPSERAFDSWALNDVGTSYFILGQSLLAQGEIEEAKQAFNTVIEQFSFAQAWDPQGWFWKVAEGAGDKLTTIGTPYDFGDYKSETLTKKAWGALDKDDHRGVELYTKKCLELYEADAKRQQAQLKDFAPKAKVFEYWALNDVATCYYILGESLIAQKRYPEAKAAFERIIRDFPLAQCWDPRGWFWKLAVGAKDRLNKILVLGGQ